MGLERYREKRNFRATPEPRGRLVRSKAKELRFVVQKHAASHLHYDFRLELNGVLLSWAVPKGPSLDPSDKRLAMHVEDHPLEYSGFEGIIPPRQYGSGTVMLWDRGTWHPIGDPDAGYAKGHLKFDLDGEKLKGRWALIRTHGSKYGGKSGKQAWLLIKEGDDYAKEGRAARIVEEEPDSAHWVKPQLVAEIAFTEWSNDGALQHPSFQGLREDKKAVEVVREAAAAGKAGDAAAPVARKRAAAAAADVVAGIKLSHPDKPYFPEAKLAKRDLAQYYEKVAAAILPHLRGRPLSLVRCPDGWSKQCFYQKHADKSVDAAVTRVEVPEGKGTATYFAAYSLPALVALVQWGVVELHPWGSRTPKLDRPDRLVFDFDPDEGVGWCELVDAIGVLRALLGDLGLAGFLKTTGGKGLHVVVPIRPTLTWDQAKGFTKAVADFLVGTFPDRFIATVSKAQRKGKIFIDYLRNAEGATAIVAYGIRARKNAPVSTPIAWKELAKDVRFDYFNVRNVPERLVRRREDPWADFGGTRQTVTRAMFKRVGFADRP